MLISLMVRQISRNHVGLVGRVCSKEDASQFSFLCWRRQRWSTWDSETCGCWQGHIEGVVVPAFLLAKNKVHRSPLCSALERRFPVNIIPLLSANVRQVQNFPCSLGICARDTRGHETALKREDHENEQQNAILCPDTRGTRQLSESIINRWLRTNSAQWKYSRAQLKCRNALLLDGVCTKIQPSNSQNILHRTWGFANGSLPERDLL